MPNIGPDSKAIGMRASASPPVISLVVMASSRAFGAAQGAGGRSGPHQGAGGVGDLVGRDPEQVLERRGVGDRHTRRSEAPHRSLQIAEAVHGDGRRNLGAEAADLHHPMGDAKPAGSSEARRVGEEGGGKQKTRGWPLHEKKK